MITQFQKFGQQVLENEAEAIRKLSLALDEHFTNVCKTLLSCQGHIIFIAVGKSGHIAKKIAATFSSTGSPAFFIHAGEASHGDLGMITTKDIVIMISYSGETEEILNVIPLIKSLNIKIIALTGNPQSQLAKQSTLLLPILITEEACPLGLAPTTSTTAMLAMGDALAIALLKTRDFKSTDFAKIHPQGSLGKRLFLRVQDIMRVGSAIPIVKSGTSLRHTLIEISQKCLGITLVVNDTAQLIGVFTDGDLRRTLDQEINLKDTPVDEMMSAHCKTISANILAVEALNLMKTNRITALPVVSDQQIPIGILHIQDILNKGIH